MSSSRNRSNSGCGPVLSSGFQRSISPSGRFCGSSKSSSSSTGGSSFASSFSSSAFASSSSSFSSRSSGFFQRSTSPNRVNLYGRSTSPNRVNLYGSVSSAPSVRFSIDRPISPSRSITASTRDQVVKTNSNRLNAPSSQRKTKTCMCSPTTHPGSFRCSLHKNFNNHHSVSFPSNRLNARRSAMTNSLVRIGTVEGDLVKRALAALIRPSSHQQRRRAAFQPRQSRLSIMSKADDL